MRSVTLNLTNKFSQCTFSIAEHYDLFSSLIILRQVWWRWSYDVIPHRTDRETAAGKAQRYHTDLKLIYMLPIMPYATSRQFSRRPLQIHPEQPTLSLQNFYAHSLKTAKRLSQLATYLAYFSVTYLATSLKLAKFSVTERTAGLSWVPLNFAQIILFSLLYMQCRASLVGKFQDRFS